MSATTPSISSQVVALTHLTAPELRERWLEVFGKPTTQRHRQYMIMQIARELQRQHFGDDLSPDARQRLDTLQEEFRTSPPATWFRGARANRAPTPSTPARRKSVRDARAPKPGTILTRVYHGQQITVTTVDAGFQYAGKVYRSLSAVAAVITGSHCSGMAFFGLTKKGGER